MEEPAECYSCAVDASPDAVPGYEHIAGDEHWRLAHAFGSGLPGWLVLLPRRHVTAIAELTGAEAASLGTWQVRASQALHAVTGCAKTYVAQFAEAAAHAHVHFHIVPRPPGLAPELRGPRIFGLIGVEPAEEVTGQRKLEIALALRRHLTGG